MKTYTVYLDGVEVGEIKGCYHGAAEKKAMNKYIDRPYNVINLILKKNPRNVVTQQYM